MPIPPFIAELREKVVRCRWVSGEPYPADGEATEARWVRVDALGELDPRAVGGVAAAHRVGAERRPCRAFRRA